MSLAPRPEVASLSSCEHGGLNYAELRRLGISPQEVIDFSINANPFGPPAGITDVLSQVPIDRYPDSEATEVRKALADKLQVSPQNIIVGNGSVELLRLVALTYLRAADSALIVQPTFGEYQLACQIMGSQIVSLRLAEGKKFTLDMGEMARLIAAHQPRLIFLCNPNNPTGGYLDREGVETLLQTSPDSLLVLDEAYISFVEDAWSSIDLLGQGNLLIVRSMTKDYALAGLRFGYALASVEIIGHLEKVRPPWNVNALAQKAVMAALADEHYLEQCRGKLAKAKEFLVRELSRLGLPPLPSRANFLLVKVGDARSCRSALLSHKILVRDCTSFGLPQYIRIAVRTLAECRQLIAALKEVKRKVSP